MHKGMLAIGLMGFGMFSNPAIAPAAEASAVNRSAPKSVLVVPQSSRDPHRGFHRQMDATEFIAHRYPQASSIGVAVALVPDPLVPRYRRLYDLSIMAIELGMLRDGFVLDRYSFPWSEELQQSSALNDAV